MVSVTAKDLGTWSGFLVISSLFWEMILYIINLFSVLRLDFVLISCSDRVYLQNYTESFHLEKDLQDHRVQPLTHHHFVNKIMALSAIQFLEHLQGW